MARMQAEIRSYFATPVVIATLPDAAEFNAELRRIILQHERQHQSVHHSNLGGWQSSWDFETWGGPPAKRLLDGARELATRLTSDRAGKAVRIAWKTNAWANVNRRNHGNEFHTHPGAYWSGTYYVDDGGIGDDHALGGEFEMQDPARRRPGHVRAAARLRGARRPVRGRERADPPQERSDGAVPVVAAARGPPLSRRSRAYFGCLQLRALSADWTRPKGSGSSPTAR